MQEIKPEQRVKALSLFLEIDGSTIKPTQYDELTLEVNRRKVRWGTSPADVIKDCQLLENGLSVIGVNKNDLIMDIKAFEELEEKEEKENKEALYHRIVEQFDLNEQTRKMKQMGIHTLVNTLYHLINPGDFPRVREYFLTGDVREYRPWSETDDGQYLVVTDEEADERWEEALENYIDECMEIPESMERYFDREAWKSDAKMDGRAHSLASYDGDESHVEIDGVLFYIYRTN